MSSKDVNNANLSLSPFKRAEMYYLKYWVRIRSIFISPSPIPKWIYKNRFRLGAGITALIFTLFFKPISNAFTNILVSIVSLFIGRQNVDKILYSDLAINLSQQTIYALLIYAFFVRRIERWLGYKIKESWRFNAPEYLLAVNSSNYEVKICETFIELLVTKYEIEFKKALRSFINNCRINNHCASIKIMVLDPYCEAARERVLGLKNAYKSKKIFSDIDFKDDEKFIEIFRREIMRGLLLRLDNIKRSLCNEFKDEKNGNKVLSFEIKLYSTKPPYSLYYCDKYASLSYHKEKPSTEDHQLIFLNTETEAAKFQIEPFNSIWDTASVLPEDYDKRPPRNEDIIRKFISISKKPDITSIFDILIDIGRDCRSDNYKIFDLIRYLEENHKRIQDGPHYNIFGSGGDKYKTINITTIAAILGSHYSDEEIPSLPIKKVGTLAVTASVGSLQFYDLLQSKLLTIKSPDDLQYLKCHDWLDFNRNNNSIYLPLTYFSYIYYDIVRIARKMIDEKSRLDIFKIIFPCANLTGYSAVINGVSKQENVIYFEAVYTEFKKTGIIVNNQSHSIDEIFMGKNNIIYYRNGIKEHQEVLPIIVPEKDIDMYKNFFKESSPEEHIKRFIKLFHPETPICIKETICYNIALILKLHYLQSDDFNKHQFMKIKMDELKDKVFDKFFG